MSEKDLKSTIKSIEHTANLDNLSKALHMTNYIMRHISDGTTKHQASVLQNDLKTMKSKGHVNHMKLQSDIASLFMFA